MSNIQWNKPSFLPTVGAHLALKMKCGKVIEGIRPKYIDKATSDNPMYRDRKGNELDQANIIGWTYQAHKKGVDK